LVLGTAFLLVCCGNLEAVDPSPACPPGVGRGAWSPDSSKGEARELLKSPNFGATPQAAGDLERGVVDRRLVAALGTLTEKHRICVLTFKKGHYFRPGVPDGPRIPEGYGEAGGLPNTHYFGRAADIWWVDGKPVEGNAADPEVLKVGRLLAGIPHGERPDQIIGPPAWSRALGYGREDGWVLAPDQLRLHEDHIHIGFVDGPRPRNTR
jgi:hypothetical protein